jgi:hypothetical protein
MNCRPLRCCVRLKFSGAETSLLGVLRSKMREKHESSVGRCGSINARMESIGAGSQFTSLMPGEISPQPRRKDPGPATVPDTDGRRATG